MNRDLATLRPEFRAKVELWLQDLASANLHVLITSTLRTAAEQDALYAKGRTVPGAIVTNAKAGQSAHEFGLALDFVIMVNGIKPDWSGYSPAWNAAILLADGREMQSLRPMESAHLQEPNWRALAAQTSI